VSLGGLSGWNGHAKRADRPHENLDLGSDEAESGEEQVERRKPEMTYSGGIEVKRGIFESLIELEWMLP